MDLRNPRVRIALLGLSVVLCLGVIGFVFLGGTRGGHDVENAVYDMIDYIENGDPEEDLPHVSETVIAEYQGLTGQLGHTDLQKLVSDVIERYNWIDINVESMEAEINGADDEASVILLYSWKASHSLYPNLAFSSKQLRPDGAEVEKAILEFYKENDEWKLNYVEAGLSSK